MKFENFTVQGLLSLILAACLSFAMAATPVIGVASSRGTFRINQSAVTGNGTILDGATLETVKTGSTVQLAGDSSKVWLGANSKGKVFRDKLVLERGSSQLIEGKIPDRGERPGGYAGEPRFGGARRSQTGKRCPGRRSQGRAEGQDLLRDHHRGRRVRSGV
jgi:hypothetical protein